MKCVAKKVKALLKCHQKAEKSGVQLDPSCLQKAMDKFEGPGKGCFAKLEQNLGKPETICHTGGDTAAMESTIDAFVADVVSDLSSP